MTFSPSARKSRFERWCDAVGDFLGTSDYAHTKNNLENYAGLTQTRPEYEQMLENYGTAEQPSHWGNIEFESARILRNEDVFKLWQENSIDIPSALSKVFNSKDIKYSWCRGIGYKPKHLYTKGP